MDVKYETENKRMWLMTWRPYRTVILIYIYIYILHRPTNRTIEVALEFMIVNILYTCNTAHFSLKLQRLYNRLENVLHVLKTMKQKSNKVINN